MPIIGQDDYALLDPALADDRAFIVSLPNVISAQQIIGYKFTDIFLLWEALQAPASGIAKINDRWMFQGNYGIAIVGDTALKTALSMEWFKTGTARSIWNTHFCTLLTDQNLAKICQKMDLWSCLQEYAGGGSGFAVKGASTLFEGIAGAIFLDAGEKGISEIQDFIERSGLMSGVRLKLAQLGIKN